MISVIIIKWILKLLSVTKGVKKNTNSSYSSYSSSPQDIWLEVIDSSSKTFWFRLLIGWTGFLHIIPFQMETAGENKAPADVRHIFSFHIC